MNQRRPKLTAPPGMFDTHIHFYDTSIPSAPGGPPLPGHYSVLMYRELQKRLGMSRVIVVQANAYQDDNRVTLAAIMELGAGAKGVAVVKAGVADAEIERLTRAGICGQRIFNLPGGAVNLDAMDAVMARVHSFGWYANIQLDGRELPKYEAQIKRLPGKFVIDHVGKFLEPVVPDRIIWASNWPHPSAPADNRPDDADLLDLLFDWAPDEATWRKILADNPAELCGFPKPGD